MAFMPRRPWRGERLGGGELQAGMRKPLDLRRVMADEQHDALRQQLKLDQLLDHRCGRGIERGGRFIEQQHARLVRQRADQPQALALAGRKLGERAIQVTGRRAPGPKAADRASRSSGNARAPSAAHQAGLGRGIANLAAPLRARASRPAPRRRDARSRRPDRDRRWRAASWSCRSRTVPPRSGIRPPPPRRRASAVPAQPNSRP